MKKIAIIGGGASGLTCAVLLARKQFQVTVFERSDRVGKKLSATGNGQGNVTNLHMGAEYYFSDDQTRVEKVLARFSERDTIAFLESMGGIFLPDGRGRVYPAGRQASAITDLLRGELARLNVPVKTGTEITSVGGKNGFCVAGEKFDAVVLCTGGMAAPNFGTDGHGYLLAKAFGHTVTPLSPSLVQLKSDPAAVRGLKGIRVDGTLTVERNGKAVYSVRGDVLFTESGVSGDAVFRASAYAKTGDTLVLDLLPDVETEKLRAVLSRRALESSLLCVVNNGLGRVLLKRADGDIGTLVQLLKKFRLPVTGTLGWAYAQVTKGGIPLGELDEFLQSNFKKRLFFAGEICNVDGECGGYNLQWAFASAYTVAEGILCS